MNTEDSEFQRLERAALLRAAQPVQPDVIPLRWSEESQPCSTTRYNHVVAESALGQATIEWKGWKESDSYDAYVHDVCVGTSYNLDDAKQLVVGYLRRMAHALLSDPILVQPVQPAIERNFCGRCGKRTPDAESIHTCTPPMQHTGEKS